MKKVYLSIIYFIFFLFLIYKQTISQNIPIKQMKWENEFTIHLELSNDSNYILNVKELYHSNTENSENDYTYYPVRLGDDFVEQLKKKKLFENGNDTLFNSETRKTVTLFSALHFSLGGGWSHFLNCLLYALETNQLNLTSPLMMRPETNWKPNPMTESYKRTKKWKYYIPLKQKLAIKEYKIKKREKKLNNLEGIPKEFIDIFFKHSDKNYEKLKTTNQLKEKARIDLVKLLLGSNYLGKAQISFIKNRVLKATSKYSVSMLPTVIIFDDLNAAVAMKLNEEGYQTESIIFYDDKYLSNMEREERIVRIESVINNINEVSKQIFAKRLKSYYK